MEHALATASGSLMGAVLLNSGAVDVAVHWGGGMHHTKCGECSGFCYINDVVLAILELLRGHDRVLYIDLDMHHGDGVDEAFCQSDRVFTLSLHKFGESFFPGTGHPSDIGVGRGRGYTMNLALWDGINDFFYTTIFRHALHAVVDAFVPGVIVLQCGADSLAGDRLGLFNLSSAGLGRCVHMVQALRLPVLVLGGGGYTVRNVAKLWAYETSVLCGHPLSLRAMVPVANMPLSGWLFENDPVLLVPPDATSRPLPGCHVQRAYRSVREQIDRFVRHAKRGRGPAGGAMRSCAARRRGAVVSASIPDEVNGSTGGGLCGAACDNDEEEKEDACIKETDLDEGDVLHRVEE